MKLFVYISFLAICNASVLPNTKIYNDTDDDAKLTVPELLTKYGYPNEEHFTTTPDGYILRLHRIKGSRNNNVTPKNKVVFVQHGLMASTFDWIISGPEHALGYALADEGYDVWMGNYRGNVHSRNHTELDPDVDLKEFWDFSWHEMGLYDLPSMIDYVLEQTGKEKLLFVGHSQGTTAFYVMTSLVPEYNDKILAHISLAPIAFQNHMFSPLMHVMAFWEGTTEALLPLIGMYEYKPTNEFMAMYANLFCSDTSVTNILCTNAMFAVSGYSPKEMNVTLLPILMGHTPAGSSTKQVLHYGQELNSGHFRQYDYGLFLNMEKYGSITPPDYPLEKITAPVYLIYSLNDWLSSEIDVMRLYQKLSDCLGKFIVSDFEFNHLDFMYGIHARGVVYNKVIALMARH